MTKDSKGFWFTVQTKKNNVQTARKIIGSSGNDKLKVKAAATKQKFLHIFAGRFQAESTADDVRDLLEDNDIRMWAVKRRPRSGKSALRLSILLLTIKTKTLSSNKTFGQPVSRFVIGCLRHYNGTL